MIIMKKYILVFLLFIFYSQDIYSQTEYYSLSEITRDLMIVDHGGSELAFVWWLPYEYWALLFDEQFIKNEETGKEMLKVLKRHNIFAVMKGEIGMSGNVVYKNAEETAQNTVFTDAFGNRYFPLKPESADARLQMLFTNFKPVFAKMMGRYGQNINMVVFDISENPESRPKPRNPGRFYIKFFEKDYSFRLPVGTFLPPKYCPIDGEQFKGSWNFCPYHGNKLSETAKP